MLPVLLIKTKHFPFSERNITGYLFFAAFALLGSDGSGSICCHRECESKVFSLSENFIFPMREFSQS